MNKKVLVIDDDIDCLEILTEYLSYKKFAVTPTLIPVCPMIEQELDACPMQESDYCIVISDNYMPGTTGLEFFECQRQSGCKIPAEHKALISGNILPEDQEMAESMGYKVFHKPTPLDLIDSWIDEVLDKHC